MNETHTTRPQKTYVKLTNKKSSGGTGARILSELLIHIDNNKVW